MIQSCLRLVQKTRFAAGFYCVPRFGRRLSTAFLLSLTLLLVTYGGGARSRPAIRVYLNAVWKLTP